jgi:hypothetical protein
VKCHRRFLATMLLNATLVAGARGATSDEAGKRARTLEAINIEGDVEAPLVQFITSRDRLRFADDAGRRFRPGALEILEGLRAPVRLRVVAPPGCPQFESIPSR